jgi:hypothetical protein
MRALCITATVFALSHAARADNDPETRGVDDDVIPGLADSSLSARATDEFLLGKSPAASHNHLNRLLREKIEVIDRCCRLSDGQKQKLQLAGQGDIKRFFDRFEEIKRRFHPEDFANQDMLETLGQITDRLDELDRSLDSGLSEDDAASAKAEAALLSKAHRNLEARLITTIRVNLRLAVRAQGAPNLQNTETQSLKRCLQLGLSDDHSLFFKALDTLLTDEQADRYQAVRAVFRCGGLVQMRRRGSDDAVEINLTDTAFSDSDLAKLSAWPALPVLCSLNLTGTNVTDAGLDHLKGLTTLKHLTLNGLSDRLSDAAVADLKRALPMLEVHW